MTDTRVIAPEAAAEDTDTSLRPRRLGEFIGQQQLRANLGYGPGEAAAAVTEAGMADAELDTAGLIRAALRLLAPKG